MRGQQKGKPELSIIILSFNVKKLLLNCLKSIYGNKPEGTNWQLIVIDNASTDGTVKAVEKRFPQVRVVESGKNLGFAAGNNLGVRVARSEWILFLNPDTIVVNNAIGKTFNFAKSQQKVGAITCKVELPGGKLDYSCHRGLPTPWNSFCYFTGLAKLLPKSGLTAGYTATYQDLSIPHEIECGCGTFFLVNRECGDKVGWWDEDYFWNGEDIEFCFRLKLAGYKVYFYPKARIVHYKGSSSGLWSTAGVDVPLETKITSARSAAQAMRIFYRKHYLKNSPALVITMVEKGVDLLEKYRLARLKKGLEHGH